MTRLLAACEALDDYAGPAADTDRQDTIPVPLRLLVALRKALEAVKA